MLESLQVQFPKEYIDDYGLEDNPLVVLIPCFEGKNFFGSCVLNLVSITKSCDASGTGPQIDFFKTVYSRFLVYESHIWINTDDFGGDPAATEAVMQDICTQLADYGFTYHGRVNSGGQSQLITELHTAFKETCRDKFGN